MAVITVLGAGMMGSALCVPLVDAGHEVRLVGTHLDGQIVASLVERSHHPTLHLDLPRTIRAYPLEALEQAMQGAEAVGIGVSSAGVSWARDQLGPLLRPGQPVLMVTKGLELHEDRLVLLPDLLRDGWPEPVRASVFPVAVAGPCIAGELGRRVPTSVVLSGRDPKAVEVWRRLLATNYYYPFASRDLVGVQVCAALKNAYAMGVGLGLGLHERAGGQPGSVAFHNYQAAVFAQAMLEMTYLVTVLGGEPATVLGLAGAGDLTVTCAGGRTSRFGRLLGLGLGPERAVEAMQGATLECLDVLRVLKAGLPALEARGKLDQSKVPLLRELIRIALEGAPVDLPFRQFFAVAGEPPAGARPGNPG